MKSVSFLHIADLHLDSPFTGLRRLPRHIYDRIKESTFASFTKLIEAAIKHKVDFVIISGDLFDLENRSLRAQSRFRNEMKRLEKEGIPAYIIHGNHDHLGGNFVHLDWPSNVHIFTQGFVEVKSFEKEGNTLVHLYGFSYHEKAMMENMISYYEKKNGALFHIGIIHGSVDGGSDDHNNYAPFRVSDLIQKEFDYWALGHIHKRQELQQTPPIIYPGNIQGRHRKESGEKGGYLINLSDSGVIKEFISTADIIWENKQINITDMKSFQQFIEECLTQINECRKTREGTLLSFEIIGSSDLHGELLENGRIEDVIETLNDADFTENFVYVTTIKVSSTFRIDRDRLKKESHFVSDMLAYIDQYEGYYEALAPFFTNPDARKLTTNFSEEEHNEILKEAESYILHHIYNRK